MRFFLLVICCFQICSLRAQQISGRTLDEKGCPIPFATIHVAGTTNGTTSNTEGNYILKVDSGTHQIIAQHIGYKKIQKRVTVDGSNVIDFLFEAQILALKEIVVISDDEDPAYRVIREAMKKRKYHRDEVNAYSCDVYIKGLQRLDTFPDKILGVKLTLDTGIVYLSESISELKYMRPNKINERMLSSKVSGNNRAFSWNQASDMLINMYDNSFELEGLSERTFVSPIANNAFLFYDYELMGVIVQDDLLINKIKLHPKRKNDPVFDGHIYIIEDQWRIFTVDALLTKARGIEFVDSLTLSQTFAKAHDDIWMPFSQRFGFQFNVFNIKGVGYFNAVYSNYQVEPNYESVPQEEKARGQEPLFQKKEFTNEIMYVEEGANERDSIYWVETRPILLSQVEIIDYHIKDSIRVVKESKPYMDSVDTERNKMTIGKLLFSGYTIHGSVDERRMSFPTVLSSFQYNTVEGAVTDLGFSYQKTVDQRWKYRINPSVRYGFSNEKFHTKAAFSYRKLDHKFTSFSGGIGRYVSQLNQANPVDEFSNTLNALFFAWSPIKLFEKGFVFGEFRQEVANGLFIIGRVEYANRSQLSNTANFTWADAVRFDSNVPTNSELGDTSFPLHQALTLDLKLRIRFNQKYQTRPDRKVTYKPNTPEFWLRYRKGINTLGSDVNYDMLELSATDNMSFGLVGLSKWSIAGGGLINSKRLSFVDYQHFNGNTLFYTRVSGLRQFQLLDNYTFSTTNAYFEGHYEHHFNEFLLNKIPLVRNLNWQTVTSVHYLKTKSIGNYLELGVGIEHIFKFMRIDYFRAFSDGKVQPAIVDQSIRIGFGF